MQNIWAKLLPFGFRRSTVQTSAANDEAPSDVVQSDVVQEATASLHAVMLPAYRDERDVRLHFKMMAVIVTLVVLTLAQFVGLIVLWLRKPTVVLMDKTSGVTITVDDTAYGMTPAATLDRDRLGANEKKAASEKFLELLYLIDPNKDVRLKDVARALKMMHPYSADKLARLMDAKQIITTQLAESQQSLWKVTDYTLDKHNPYLAHIHADQTLTRTPVGGQPETRKNQCVIKVMLRPDPDGRREENANTGMQIVAYDFKVLPSEQPVSSPLENYNFATGTNDVRIEPPPKDERQSSADAREN